jgi:AraC-like DNA-binding protein
VASDVKANASMQSPMLANLFELLIFGSLILLGIILIANPLQVNNRANTWFGIFLFIWASFWLEEIVFMISGNTVALGPSFLLSFIQFVSPLIFFVSICYFTNPEYGFNRRGLLFLTMPAIYAALLTLNNVLAINISVILLGLLFLHGFTYLLLSAWRIRTHKKRIQQFASSTIEIDLTWLEYIVWAAFFLIVGVSIFNLLFYDTPLNLFMNGFVYAVVLFTAYHSLKQKEIFPEDKQERAEALSVVSETRSSGNQNKLMTDDKLVEVKAQLYDLIRKEEAFLDSELNLGKLARRLNISSHQLSYVINNGYNQNFYGFINRFRVEKAKKLLADKELDKYSIIGIAFESGFNSKTSFNITFKKLTGQTPTEFKKTCSGL